MQLVGGIEGSKALWLDDIAGFVYRFLGTSARPCDYLPLLFSLGKPSNTGIQYSYIPTQFKIDPTYGSLNSRNSWRKGEELPTESRYGPAQYRFAYTTAMT